MKCIVSGSSGLLTHLTSLFVHISNLQTPTQQTTSESSGDSSKPHPSCQLCGFSFIGVSSLQPTHTTLFHSQWGFFALWMTWRATFGFIPMHESWTGDPLDWKFARLYLLPLGLHSICFLGIAPSFGRRVRAFAYNPAPVLRFGASINSTTHHDAPQAPPFDVPVGIEGPFF